MIFIVLANGRQYMKFYNYMIICELLLYRKGKFKI